MEVEGWWLLLALPVAFALGWLGSRIDLRQWRSEERAAPKAYFRGLNLLLNEQQDKAIDAFIEAVQHDPDTTELHFALGNLFRRRGEYDRAVRVHEHLLSRADLPRGDREKAQHALAQDFFRAGLFDRAETGFRALEDTRYAPDARLALLTLYERARDWPQAIEIANKLQGEGTASFATRVAHYWCEIAIEADLRQDDAAATQALDQAQVADPKAPRPIVLAGQRQARAGRDQEALNTWSQLLQQAPQAVPLVAADWARAAVACERQAEVLAQLRAFYDTHPSVDVLAALRTLELDPAKRREWMVAHLAKLPSVSVGVSLLDEVRADGAAAPQGLSPGELHALHAVLARAASPQNRYRCAACGFEARQHFWQCPGCQTWDSFPTRRVEEL